MVKGVELDGSGRNIESILGGSLVIFSPSGVLSVAEATGFNADVVEKVLHLLNLLNTLNTHPFLKGKLALKGGSAINLFVLNIPRLSVDIDLNYIGAVEREKMLADRPKVEKAVEAVFAREGFSVKRKPAEHAGGKWRLSYQSYKGLSGNLEVDLNFMFREPLWEVQTIDSKFLGEFQATNIPILDIHELAAGKLAALFARRQARDLFDVHQLLCNTKLKRKRLRVAFFVYGALNRKDWRTISLEDIEFDPEELNRTLVPVLHGDYINRGEDMPLFARRLMSECREKLSVVFPPNAKETAFLDRILTEGEIEPALLTSDSELKIRIMRHPMLIWKVINVRKHFGLQA
jgi:predicted nucleotidyltransferase component of viral defense system